MPSSYIILLYEIKENANISPFKEYLNILSWAFYCHYF